MNGFRHCRPRGSFIVGLKHAMTRSFAQEMTATWFNKETAAWGEMTGCCGLSQSSSRKKKRSEVIKYSQSEFSFLRCKSWDINKPNTPRSVFVRALSLLGGFPGTCSLFLKHKWETATATNQEHEESCSEFQDLCGFENESVYPQNWCFEAIFSPRCLLCLPLRMCPLVCPFADWQLLCFVQPNRAKSAVLWRWAENAVRATFPSFLFFFL